MQYTLNKETLAKSKFSENIDYLKINEQETKKLFSTGKVNIK